MNPGRQDGFYPRPAGLHTGFFAICPSSTGDLSAIIRLNNGLMLVSRALVTVPTLFTATGSSGAVSRQPSGAQDRWYRLFRRVGVGCPHRILRHDGGFIPFTGQAGTGVYMTDIKVSVWPWRVHAPAPEEVWRTGEDPPGPDSACGPHGMSVHFSSKKPAVSAGKTQQP